MIKKFKESFDELLGRKIYRRYLEAETRKQRLYGQFYSFLLFIAILYYLIWCIVNANWKVWYMFVPFIAAEIATSSLVILTVLTLWNKRRHRKEGIPCNGELFSVDIFIPTFNEPLYILENTVKNAVEIDYKNKKIYILDDAGRVEVKELARKYNVNYIARPTHENRKAGNLNYALSKTKGDLILALDADQVPEKDILKHTVGYFHKISKLAFVLTKQRFHLPEGDPWDNADTVFYEVMMPAKDSDNAVFSCGSGVIYRRKALEEIGGFSTWNLVEDLHTSLIFHDKGWITIYHNHAYTTGTAPAEVHSELKQRWQWAVDTLRMFFWDNPFKRRGLNIYQKLQYFHVCYFYIVFGVFLPVLFILPIWALFTYKFILIKSPFDYLMARLPYLILQQIAYHYIMEGKNSFKSFGIKASMSFAFFSAIITAIRSKNEIPVYTVTSKIAGSTSLFARLYKCFPHIVLTTFAFIAPCYGYLTIKNDFWFLTINTVWCCWVIATLSPFIALSLFPEKIVKYEKKDAFVWDIQT